MTTSVEAWRFQIDLVREQAWYGYLTIKGLQASHATLHRYRDQLPDELKPEADWLLAQLSGELFMRELDAASGEVSS